MYYGVRLMIVEGTSTDLWKVGRYMDDICKEGIIFFLRKVSPLARGTDESIPIDTRDRRKYPHHI